MNPISKVTQPELLEQVREDETAEPLCCTFKPQDMGNLMVSNIKKAIVSFTEAEVHKRGYFKAKIETHPDINWERPA
jgi:hypothetical protein